MEQKEERPGGMAFAQAWAVFVRSVATWFVGSVPIGALWASEVTDGACDVACCEARLGLAVGLVQIGWITCMRICPWWRVSLC